jgi:hypothetical protein
VGCGEDLIDGSDFKKELDERKSPRCDRKRMNLCLKQEASSGVGLSSVGINYHKITILVTGVTKATETGS